MSSSASSANGMSCSSTMVCLSRAVRGPHSSVHSNDSARAGSGRRPGVNQPRVAPRLLALPAGQTLGLVLIDSHLVEPALERLSATRHRSRAIFDCRWPVERARRTASERNSGVSGGRILAMWTPFLGTEVPAALVSTKAVNSNSNACSTAACCRIWITSAQRHREVDLGPALGGQRRSAT